MRARARHWEAGIRLFIFLVSVVFSILLLRSPAVAALLHGLGNAGYLGAFIAGLFFTTGATILPAFAVLAILAETLSPFPLALVAGLAAAAMDTVLVWVIHTKVMHDVDAFTPRLGRGIRRLHGRAPLMKFLLPLIGGLILASPLPDELALALIGTSNVTPQRFFWYAFVVKFLAVLVLALAVA